MRIFSPFALLPDGWRSDVLVSVDGAGDIERVEANASARDADVRVGALLPGIANLHSHAFQRAMSGLTEVAGPAEDSFWTWRQLMYRFVARLTPEDIEAIAARLYLEMLRHGYTGVAEFHYLHHNADGTRYADPGELSLRCIAAARETGIALTHLPVLYAHGGFGGAHPEQTQRRFVNDVDAVLTLVDELAKRFSAEPDIRLGAAAHSLRAVTPQELTHLHSGLQALDSKAPLHVHIAEQTREVEECLAWSGARPVDWLLDNQAVDARWCLIHATQVTDGEVRRMAASGAVVGLCPTTEANLGDGLFPACDYQRYAGAFGIGSDSHVSTSPVEELRWLEYGQRLLHRRRNLLAGGARRSTGSALYTTALQGGAQALARNTGAIAVGKRADLVALDTQHVTLVGRSNEQFVDAWLFAGNDTPVSDVFAGGRHVIENGRHARGQAISERYRATLRRILEDL
ncbi:MAG: formimidoylglutamate deiminase [Gammaproteobacteria bacterium]|nr:formimidoylglutamate deiminase [Gammaproteobacteria bacterium]